MNKTKFALAVSALTTVALAMAGCGNSASGGNGKAAPKGNPKAIILTNGCEPEHPLVPQNTNETCGGNPIQLLFSGLVSVATNGKVENNMAESITPSNGNKTFTIKIKKGLKFSDGTEVKADNFIKAWSYGAVATNAQVSSYFFAPIMGYDDVQKEGTPSDTKLSGLEKLDDYSFTVNLSNPSSVFTTMLAYPAFSPLPDSFFKDPKAFGEKPVSYGPYKFKSWTHNQSIELVKNADYKGTDPAKNGGVTFKVYLDTEAAYRDVQAGNLDVMDTIPQSQLKLYKKDKKVQGYSKPGSTIQAFSFPKDMKHFEQNTEEGKLRRRAVSMSIDRQQLIDKVLSGVGTPATDFIPPVITGHKSDLENSKYVKYNPEEAKKLWAQADKISKWTEKDTLNFAYNADGGAKPIFDAVANSVKNTLGINATSKAYPTFAQYRQLIGQRKMQDIFRAGWMPDYPSAQNYLAPLYSTGAGNGNGSNDNDYSNPEVDKLLSDADSAATQEEAVKAYQKIDNILLGDLGSVPMYYGNASGVAALGIGGFQMNWQNEPVFTDLTKA